VLAAPDYARIDLVVEVAVADAVRSAAVEERTAARLREYLHPVYGRAGAGTEFGRYPEAAELYALLESVQGVEHVRSLDIVLDPRYPKLPLRFLAYPGTIDVTAVLE
jgi:hypothetical protein